jgi:hypothetical protein
MGFVEVLRYGFCGRKFFPKTQGSTGRFLLTISHLAGMETASMKRPCIALSVLLATLAACLVVSPQGSQACSLGELAVAMQVVHHDCDAATATCPLAACPRLDECEEEESSDVDLNAPASDEQAVDPECDECFGAYEDYSDDYADQYADSQDDCQSPVVEAAPDLNAAACDTTAVDCFEDYGCEYAEEYREEAEPAQELTPEEPVYVDEDLPCEWDCDEAACDTYDEDACDNTCEEGYGEEQFYSEQYNPYRAVVDDAASQPSDEDLIVDECDAAAAPSCPEVDGCDSDELTSELVNPYDAYGRQVGDSYEAEAACPEAVEPSDCEYDEYCEGYDCESYDCESSDCESYDCESYDCEGYRCDAAEEPGDEVTETQEAEAGNTTVQVCPGSYDDCYGDCYGDCYDRYYGCEDGAEATAEESADDEFAAPASESEDAYVSGYDAAYDEAVYGPQEEYTPCDDAPPAYDEAMLEDESEYDLPTLPEAVNEPLVENDLPWADADEFESEPAPSAEVESEYGSDYAEDYYGSLAHEVELPEEAVDEATDEDGEDSEDDDASDEDDANNDEDQADEDCHEELIPPLYEGETHYDCEATDTQECVSSGGLDVSRLAVACGQAMAQWSELLSNVTQVVRTAHQDWTSLDR